MDYQNLETLDQLLRDSSATEFREVLPDIPVNKFANDFYQWVDKDGPDEWGYDYHPVFAGLGRLVRAHSSFDMAMSEIKTLQQQLRPATPAEKTVDDTPPEPGEASKNASGTIGPAIIGKLLQEHPEFVADVPPEVLSQVTAEAMGKAIGEVIS